MKLSVKNLGFKRGEEWLFQKIDFEVGPHECLQITGANGAGKTTLLRILAGLIETSQGKITWGNCALTQDFPTFFQYIGHKSGLKSNLTAEENLLLYAALKNRKLLPSELNKIITKMHLSHLRNIKIHHLSAGQTRRLSLARLLVHPVPLWILDEPLSALDETTERLIIEMINTHLIEGGLVVAATHTIFLSSQITLHLTKSTCS